ncbi:MAG TPA: hypothetical protein VLV83_14830 [Acidobacteriota bacterium]|nr:hypothetical protein [Acidobacteriota bacterium]
MGGLPTEINFTLTPQDRFDVIDVTKLKTDVKDLVGSFRNALFCSLHTTAGYLDQKICARLNHCPDSLHTYLMGFRRLFPPDAPYRHDQIHLRDELSEEQKQCEPRNADSHLTFISSGLKNCVSYRTGPETPVYFIDLDGVYESQVRRRYTTVIGYNQEEPVARSTFVVPASRHAVDSINLKDPRLGLFEMVREEIQRRGIEKGRVHIRLAGSETHAGLTMNEYETLLMRHDLAEVLHNPFRFMAEKGRNMWRDPRAIPNKTINYAKYDLVQVVNELVDVLGISDTVLERFVGQFLTVTASRFLRMERSVDIPVSDRGNGGSGKILEGTYQSPILMQWNKSESGDRRLEVNFSRFI